MKKAKAGTLAHPAVRVVMESEVARQVRQHARTSIKSEVCGVLIGKEEGATTVVEACIAGSNAAQGGAHVTFTQDTWEHIYQVKDNNYPDSRIVGWYHSHPGFGIFLSDHDLFIHQNFFSAPQQIAWVFDPHSDEEGCFGWREGSIQKVEDVAFRFGHARGDTIATQADEGEVLKVSRTAHDRERDWMSLLRNAAMYLLCFAVGGVAAFYYITNRAHLLPRGGTALVIVEGDKIGVVPPEVAMHMLDVIQREYDAKVQSSKPPASSAEAPKRAPGGNSNPQGEQDARKK